MKLTDIASVALVSGLMTFAPARAESSPLDGATLKATAQAVVKLMGELIEADTSNPPGNEEKAVKILEKRIKEAGLPYEITEFASGRKNIVTRLKGNGAKRPVLLMAHLDVVGSNPKEWVSDPHRLIERDGYFVGRGTADDLGMAAVSLETVIALKNQGVKLDRDIIVALTGSEESDGLGIKEILKDQPRSIDAELALNEGGFMILDDTGKMKSLELQYAEKVYCDFKLTARGTGGHSSVPRADNSIYRMSEALGRFAKEKLPIRLTPAVRAYLAAEARVEPPEMAKAMLALSRAKGAPPRKALAVIERDDTQSASLRTTCIATLIKGGIRENSLPTETQATLNCRVFPDESIEELQKKIVSILADPTIDVRPQEHVNRGPPSPADGFLPRAVAKIANELWPGVPVIPVMSRGATDARYTRSAGIDTYGLYPFAMTQEDARRLHGIDERVPVPSVERGVDFYYRLLVELAGAGK